MADEKDTLMDYLRSLNALVWKLDGLDEWDLRRPLRHAGHADIVRELIDGRALGRAAARTVLERGSWGVLATGDDGGQPYGVPVNYAYDGAESLLIHGAPDGHRLAERLGPDDPRARDSYVDAGLEQVAVLRFEIERLTGKERPRKSGVHSHKG